MDAFSGKKDDTQKSDSKKKKPSPPSSDAPDDASEDAASAPSDAFGGGGDAASGMGGAPPSDPMAMNGSVGGPSMGVGGGQMASTPPAGDVGGGVMEQNAGMFSVFQEMEQGIKGSTDFLMMLAGQFPGAGEPIRRVLEGLQMAEMGLLDVIQAVTVEAAQPQLAAPRSAF